MLFFRNKDRKLGIAEEKRRYDLPLNKDRGTDFLVVLIALMTFLTIMALSAAFALNTLTYRWSSGLENKLTIEIPAQDADGKILTKAQIEKDIAAVEQTVRQNKAIRSVFVLQDADIQELVSPWLGEGIDIGDIPMPGLISVEMQTSNDAILSDLRARVKEALPRANVDAHEGWLAAILRLTGSLQFAAAFITLIIIATTIVAVMGAIRSRIAIHKSDIELLHLMGASDPYISKQFQRHAFILGLQGSAFGVLSSAALLLLIFLFMRGNEDSLIPTFTMTWDHVLAIFFIPALACVISAITARLTVMRALKAMP